MLKQTKIVTRIMLGFALILLAALILGVLAANSITQMTQTAADVFRHPFTVTRSILEVRADVLAGHNDAAALRTAWQTTRSLPEVVQGQCERWRS